jgi:hypothetical protein
MMHRIEPSHAKIVLLQEIPPFYPYFTSATPEGCLTMHSSAIQNYQVMVKQVKMIETTVGLNAVATRDGLSTVPTPELFSGSVRCDVSMTPPSSHLINQD